MENSSKHAEFSGMQFTLSYCHVSRLLRPFIRRRPPFLAILVVRIENMDGYFELAIEAIFKKKGRNFNRNEALSVRRIKPGRSSNDAIYAAAQSGDRFVVLLFTDESDVPSQYRASADVYHVADQFDEGLMIGAVYRLCQTSISQEDASYLLEQPLEQVAAAFRKGRSGRRSLQLLRRADSQESDRRRSKIQTKVSVGIEELHGYGEAQSWGIQVIKDIKSFIDGRINWDDIDPGVLLSGPSGTGKTRFAQVLADSSGLPLIRSSASAWQAAGHLGDMLREMRASFREAMENSPSILLIDEMDSIGDRTQLRGDNQDYGRQVINAVLECLDGALARPGVIVIGTTNYPNHIDKALLRPGRMDQHIRIKLPDATARLGILYQLLGIQVDDEKAHHVSELTEGWTGAQLDQLARRARRRARESDRNVTSEDVVESMPESITISTERLHVTAVHECGHAIVASALGTEIGSIRILDRYDKEADEIAIGAVHYRRNPEARRTLNYYLDEICILMAGIAAELEIVGEHDDGVGGTVGADLSIATKLATMIECSFGMGDSLISEEATEQELSLYRLRDPAARRAIDHTLFTQLHRSQEIVRLNRTALEKLVAVIMRQKKMTGDEMASFFKDSGHQIIHLPAETSAPKRGLSQ